MKSTDNLFYIKVSYWIRIMLSPVRSFFNLFIGIMGTGLALLFIGIGIWSFFAVGLWGIIVVLFLIWTFANLADWWEHKVISMKNSGFLTNHDTESISAFFEELNSFGWTEKLEEIYTYLPYDSTFTLKQILEYSIATVEEAYLEDPNHYYFTEPREECLPENFNALRNPLFSIWVYERFCLSIGKEPIKEILHDIEMMIYRYDEQVLATVTAESEAIYAEKMRAKRLKEENAKKLNFLEVELKNMPIDADWRSVASDVKTKYREVFGEDCEHKIVRANGEWIISR